MSANMRSNCCEATCPFPAVGRHPGPERQYAVVESVVRQIWLTAEQPCGKRLAPVLRQWLPFYEGRYGQLSARQRSLIVSPATLDRLLAPARAEHWRGRSGTKPGSFLRSEIPIRTGIWDLSRPGFLEADSVAHCGTSLAGSFIWSLTYTDILSGWTEGGTCGTKEQRAYHPGHRTEAGKPLPLAEIPPLVFSELMRDADLFAGVARVGNDPAWSDGHQNGHQKS